MGAEQQRSARTAAGLDPISTPTGFTSLQGTWKALLFAIPWGQETDPMPPEHDDRRLTADGGPFCEACHGSRWLMRRPTRDVRDNVWVACPVCQDAIEPLQRNALAARANLTDAQARKTFDRFQQVPGAEEAFRAALAFARQPDGWLHVYGLAGSGKTHLGLAITNSLIYRLDPVRWEYVADLITAAKDMIGQEQGPEFLRRRLESAPVLVLDDLGTARSTPWAIQEFLEPLVNIRYNARRPTVFTSLGDARAIREHLSESIGRRLQDPSVCVSVCNAAEQWGRPA